MKKRLIRTTPGDQRLSPQAHNRRLGLALALFAVLMFASFFVGRLWLAS